MIFGNKGLKVMAILTFFCCLSCKTRQSFFNYDAIDYYYNREFSENDALLLENLMPGNALDSVKKGVMEGSIPVHLNDLSFVDSLPRMGYRHRSLSKTRFGAIDGLFCDKGVASEQTTTTCTHVYRDILIFKRSGKVVGTAKLCFSCGAHEIRGAQGNADLFGQGHDYWILEKLLAE